MNAPLSRYLVRFPGNGPKIAAIESERDGPQVIPEASEHEARLESVRAETDRLSAIRHADEIAALRAAHQDEVTHIVARARADQTAEVGASTAAMIDRAFADLRNAICEQVAEVLRPLLAEALVSRARAAVTDALDRILTDTDRPPIVVRGPADALAAIRAACVSADSIEFIVAEGVEVSVTAGETMIETKLGAALSMLDRDDH